MCLLYVVAVVVASRRTGRPTSTRSTPASPSKGQKGTSLRSRSKSPFRSFRWKKSSKSQLAQTVASASDDEANYDDDEERRSSTAGGDDSFEGTVNRKHEWESTTKKASNRSWDKVYLVLRNGELAVYKDQKSARAAPQVYHRNENPINICSAASEKAADYTKKRHVFRLKLSNGGEFLFQAKDDDEMSGWVAKLANFTVSEAGAGPSRAQTLPAHATKDEPKRRSFFTLKKK